MFQPEPMLSDADIVHKAAELAGSTMSWKATDPSDPTTIMSSTVQPRPNTPPSWFSTNLSCKLATPAYADISIDSSTTFFAVPVVPLPGLLPIGLAVVVYSPASVDHVAPPSADTWTLAQS